MKTRADKILKRYGFVWKTSSYRIEDKNHSIIQEGPSFDLRESALKYQKEALKRRLNSQFRVAHPLEENK